MAPGILATITDEGAYESSDYGDHWSPIDSGLSIASVIGITYKDSMLYVGLATRGVMRSRDNGKSWQMIRDSLIDDSYKLLSKGSQLYAVGTATIFQWDGHVWHPFPQLENQAIILTICADTSGKLFAGSNGGLWSLPKGSSTWISMPSLSGMPVDLIACDSGNILYALVRDFPAGDSPYISKDDGNSWSVLQMPGDAAMAYTMAANIDTLSVATSFRLYRTRDHGATWTTQPLDKYDSIGFSPIGLAFHGGQTFVYNENEIIETESDTSAWHADSGYAGLLTSMTIADNNIAYLSTGGRYLGNTGQGIYSRLLQMKSASVISPIPERDAGSNLKIFQTQNHLTVTSNQPDISLHIFNVLGDELLSKYSSGTLEADLTLLTSGIYFAVVETSNTR